MLTRPEVGWTTCQNCAAWVRAAFPPPCCAGCRADLQVPKKAGWAPATCWHGNPEPCTICVGLSREVAVSYEQRTRWYTDEQACPECGEPLEIIHRPTFEGTVQMCKKVCYHCGWHRAGYVPYDPTRAVIEPHAGAWRT